MAEVKNCSWRNSDSQVREFFRGSACEVDTLLSESTSHSDKTGMADIEINYKNALAVPSSMIFARTYVATCSISVAGNETRVSP